MTCTICGNATNNRVHHAREMMMGLRDPFTYLECSACGCLQLMEPPTDMGKYYPRDYYSFAITPLAIFNNPVKNTLKGVRDSYAVTNRGLFGKLLYARMPELLLRTLAPTGVTKSSRIVDVGCGSGLLPYMLTNAGFGSVLGIDPFIDETITYQNGLMIRKESIHELTGTWDLVMFHHAFEHVPDPLETLRSVHRVVADGGSCLIRIPVASSYAWQHYGINWVQLDAPRHYFLQTVASMRLAADQAGLAVERVEYDSTAFQFWGSEQYIKDIPLHSAQSYAVDPAKSPFTPAEIAAYEARATALNAQAEGDQAIFYLRKAGSATPAF